MKQKLRTLLALVAVVGIAALAYAQTGYLEPRFGNERINGDLDVVGTVYTDALTNSGASTLAAVTASGATTLTTLNVTGASTLATMTATSVNGLAETRVVHFGFGDTDVAASQSAAEWGTDSGSDAGGAIKRHVMPKAGSIIGVSVWSNAAATSGTLTADPTINGTVTGLQAGLNSVDDTTTSYSTQAIDTDSFTAGQAVGVKITTTGTWTPTTADVGVDVIVEY